MNRTDRLYALVEELRAVAPRPRSARWLADRFEVSRRTIERDIAALQQSGAPIYAEAGRRGGYVVDRAATLPPRHLTAVEVTALATALAGYRGPFAAEARAALMKLLGSMPREHTAAARSLTGSIVVTRGAGPETIALPAIESGISQRRIVRLRYRDRHGAATDRDVEPAALVGVGDQWYLLGWCHLRQAGRLFRLDRVVGARLTTRPYAVRSWQELLPADAPATLRPLALG